MSVASIGGPAVHVVPMTAVLGISAHYHDSAGALVVEGEVVAAVEEERFSRLKHDGAFPERSVAWCLQAAGVEARSLDAVVFYDKPVLKMERLLETYLALAPRGLRSFMRAAPTWLDRKLFVHREIDRALGDRCEAPLYYTHHHEAHAASAFLASPFEEAAIVTLDGVGEWSTSTWGVGRGARVELRQEQRFPHSLGLLYSAFTQYTGFRVNSGEYKVMGLAPYADPAGARRFLDLLREHVVDLRDDGSLWMDQSYFDYCAGLTMTSARFHALFGAPPRPPEAPLTQRVMDLAGAIQSFTEEVVLRVGRHVHRQTGMKRLCLAGGVALNCVANGRLLREGPFDDLWIQPAAGDAGGALGAALQGYHAILGRPRSARPGGVQRGSLLGPSFDRASVRACLDGVGARYTAYDDEGSLHAAVVELLASGKVVARFDGPMEFGPRALGNRSILADPREPSMQKTLNLRVKLRESFRPFAPACLEEHAGDYFELDRPSPYMLLVAPVSAAHRRPLAPGSEALQGLARLDVERSDIPAVTHVDGTARIQTVAPEPNPRFHALLRAFHERTGCPVLINTSFNLRGEPVVCTPEDAWRCFAATDIDALLIGDHLCLKADQRLPESSRRTAPAALD